MSELFAAVKGGRSAQLILRIIDLGGSWDINATEQVFILRLALRSNNIDCFKIMLSMASLTANCWDGVNYACVWFYDVKARQDIRRSAINLLLVEKSDLNKASLVVKSIFWGDSSFRKFLVYKTPLGLAKAAGVEQETIRRMIAAGAKDKAFQTTAYSFMFWMSVLVIANVFVPIIIFVIWITKYNVVRVKADMYMKVTIGLLLAIGFCMVVSSLPSCFVYDEDNRWESIQNVAKGFSAILNGLCIYCVDFLMSVKLKKRWLNN